MMVRWLLPLFLAATVTAQAGEGPARLVEDPRGDTFAPAVDGFDLVAIEAGDETPEGLWLRMRVAQLAGPPPLGEIAAHFQVNGSWWLAGWTTVAFPTPPFVYQGGFYCPTDANLVVNSAHCDAFEAKAEGNAFSVKLDRATLHALDAGLVLSDVWAYADVYNYDGTLGRMDKTAKGTPYTFRTGNATPVAPEQETGDVPATTPPAEPAPEPIAAPTAQGSAPGLSALGAPLALVLAGWGQRRLGRRVS